MRALVLGSHRLHDVVVDHCSACRLVWFDSLESVHLDVAGWIRLLRELGQAGPPPAPQGAVAHPACPSCAVPLKPVQNRSRYGLFAALECPARHGHLHSHSGALAERGFVRPLGAAERRALAAERHPLMCFNCGGPASAGDEQCGWCGTPLVVLDLPRLAHSLRPRAQAEAPSPAQRGQHVAWSCRGCGAPLDPGRETSCSRCGHLVVALGVADIEPLLQAAEAELATAAHERVRRKAAFASARREREAHEQAEPIVTRRERSRSPVRAAVLGWSVLLVAALVTAVLASLDLLGPPMRAVDRLQQQRLTGVAEADWGWLEVQRLLDSERPARTEALTGALLERHARMTAGLALVPPHPRVGEVIEARIARRGSVEAALLHPWHLGLQRHLRPVADAAAAEPPAAEVERLGRLSPVAATVWLDAATRQSAVWTPTFENSGPLALVVSEAHVRMMVDARDGMPWRCRVSSPAGAGEARSQRRPEQPVLVRPGERVSMICRTPMAMHPLERLWLAVLPQLQAGTVPTLHWELSMRSWAETVEAAAEQLAADGARRSLPADRFLRTYTRLRDGEPPVSGVDATPPWLTVAERWNALSPTRRAVVWGALAVALLAAFGLLTRRLGTLRGGAVTWLATAPVAYAMGGGEGTASVLLVGMYWALAAIGLFVLAFALRLVRGALGIDAS